MNIDLTLEDVRLLKQGTVLAIDELSRRKQPHQSTIAKFEEMYTRLRELERNKLESLR
jgi:hypothetical protein